EQRGANAESHCAKFERTVNQRPGRQEASTGTCAVNTTVTWEG
ncbi:MAG: hypothetical protein ACI835_006023, partial [Planctomycetota bacterium]